jgi:hypothetical protein
VSTLAPYRCRTDALPPTTVRRQDVGAAAWFALLRDGVLRPLWHDVGLRADLAETPALRAAGLAALVPRRAVVGRVSAAWVHLGGPAPARVDLVFAPGHRRTDPHPLRAAAEASLSPGDVVRIGPVRVTTVQRTGLDLARTAPPDQAERLLTALRARGFDPDRALDDLARLGPVRDVRRAREVLRACAGLTPG